MTEWTIGASDAGTRLDKFLAAADRLGSRGKAAAALERGKIYVNGEEALLRDASRALAEGDHIRFWVDRPGSAKSRPRVGIVGDLDVVYEDDRLIVVSKPAGLLSVPLERNPGIPSVYDQIEERFRPFGKMRPLVVHRIDQDTSGLVVFAKDEEAQLRMKEQFKRREPERIYRAVVYGTPDPPEGMWRDYLAWDEKRLIQKHTHPKDPRASEAISYYRTVEPLRGATVIEVTARERTPQPGQDPGAAARPYARRRAALRVRPGHAAADRFPAACPARVPARVPPSRGRPPAGVRRRASSRLPRAHFPVAVEGFPVNGFSPAMKRSTRADTSFR